MNDRKIISVFLTTAILLEGVLLVNSGLISWLTSGPHTAEQFRAIVTDWRTALSVALVTIILWLAYIWFRVGDRRTSLENKRGPRR